ncbi:MAG: hypothetical protein ACR2IK_21860 [Chloroflexota bacterium]
MNPTPPASPVPSSSGKPAGGEPGGIVDQTQQKAGEVLDKAQQTAGQVTEQAKQQATSQLESQKDRAVDSLVTVAQALRQTGQHLNEQDQGTVGGYVEKAAERVEGFTNHLRTRDVPQLLGDVEDLARRRPGVFLATAVALGFAGARFLKSSGQRGSQRQRALPSPSQSGAPYGGYASSRPAQLPSQIPSGRDTAHRPPGPVGTVEPDRLTRAPEVTSGLGESARPRVIPTDPWRRPEAENA